MVIITSQDYAQSDEKSKEKYRRELHKLNLITQSSQMFKHLHSKHKLRRNQQMPLHDDPQLLKGMKEMVDYFSLELLDLNILFAIYYGYTLPCFITGHANKLGLLEFKIEFVEIPSKQEIKFLSERIKMAVERWLYFKKTASYEHAKSKAKISGTGTYFATRENTKKVYGFDEKYYVFEKYQKAMKIIDKRKKIIELNKLLSWAKERKMVNQHGAAKADLAKLVFNFKKYLNPQ